MSKKETTNPKEVRNQNYETKKMNTSENFKKKKDKDLPWWVELLFVQIGLPDKLLIKILKALGVNNIKLLTNSGTPKLIGLEGYGLKILKTIPIKKYEQKN